MEVANHAVISPLKNWRLRICVDHQNMFRTSTSSHVLNSSADATGNVKFRWGKLRGQRKYVDPHSEYETDCSLVMWRNADKIEEQLGGFFSVMKLCDDWKTKIVRRLDTVDPEQSEKQRLRLELQINRAKKLFM